MHQRIKKFCCNFIFISMMTVMLASPLFAAEDGFTALSDAKTMEAGQKAVEINALDLDKNEVTLTGLSDGKVVFLLFWSVFCQPCQEEMPVIDELYKKVGKDDLKIIAISVDGDRRAPMIKKFNAKYNYEFTYIMDIYDEEIEDFAALAAYGVPGTPTSFMINKNGVITYSHTGKATIEELLKRFEEAKTSNLTN